MGETLPELEPNEALLSKLFGSQQELAEQSARRQAECFADAAEPAEDTYDSGVNVL